MSVRLCLRALGWMSVALVFTQMLLSDPLASYVYGFVCGGWAFRLAYCIPPEPTP